VTPEGGVYRSLGEALRERLDDVVRSRRPELVGVVVVAPHSDALDPGRVRGGDVVRFSG